mgnify:CR=1 FL=1
MPARDLDDQLPKFSLKPKEVYVMTARAMTRAAGSPCCTWAQLRLEDMRLQLPQAAAIANGSHVREAYLWYLAYQQQLLADILSEEHEVRAVAESEL